MDHIRKFREMSVRRIVALAFAGAILVTMTLFGVAAGLLAGEGPGGEATLPLTVVWGCLGGSVGISFVLWLWADRMLLARRHDHRSLPARPEFYDFQNLKQPMHWQEIEGKNLNELSYVVFDTETTGLHPSKGDEIISIAAVRVENGQVDEATAYSRLVYPGGPIAPDSIQFHGITDDMVKDEDGIADVLPSFREYVGDAILIAHNAAFDMKFLQLKEQQTGITFPNLVLDTLLISVFLDHESHNHTLDGIAQQMGITIEGRHTALGDSVATAKVFCKMINRLEARGITSLRRVVEASSKIEHVRKMQERF